MLGCTSNPEYIPRSVFLDSSRARAAGPLPCVEVCGPVSVPGMKSTGRKAADKHHREAKFQCQICLGVTQLKLFFRFICSRGMKFDSSVIDNHRMV